MLTQEQKEFNQRQLERGASTMYIDTNIERFNTMLKEIEETVVNTGDTREYSPAYLLANQIHTFDGKLLWETVDNLTVSENRFTLRADKVYTKSGKPAHIK